MRACMGACVISPAGESEAMGRDACHRILHPGKLRQTEQSCCFPSGSRPWERDSPVPGFFFLRMNLLVSVSRTSKPKVQR